MDGQMDRQTTGKTNGNTDEVNSSDSDSNEKVNFLQEINILFSNLKSMEH